MVISDLRMESDAAGAEVIAAARSAPYHPAVALLTAFPLAEEDWQSMGADKMLVKPMHTRVLLQQIEKLLASHESKLSIWSAPAPTPAAKAATPAKKSTGKRLATKAPIKKPAKKGAVTKTKPIARKAIKR
jgi:DNA-binding response OmpR family regulator